MLLIVPFIGLQIKKYDQGDGGVNLEQPSPEKRRRQRRRGTQFEESITGKSTWFLPFFFEIKL